MTREEFLELPYHEQLKIYIRDSEERYIWYKKQLENVFKDRVTFPPDDSIIIWYKEWLRELKNTEESYLKGHIEALTDIRQGGDGMRFIYKRKVQQ